MSRAKKRVLVTGAAGFIGSHLSERLVAAGWYVIGIDNFNNFYSPASKRRNLAWLSRQRSFRLVRGDIRRRQVLEQAFAARPRVVIHLAAMAGVRPSMERPQLYQQVNVGGTLALLEMARRRHIRHFVFGSSSSVYGNSRHVPFREDDTILEPVSVYAATKRAGELLCHTYHQGYGMPITMLRFFTVYGPRQRPDLAIHKFSRLMLAGKPIPFFGDGSMERDYTYIDDIVAGVMKALDSPDGLRLFNLGSDRPVRLDALVRVLEQTLGVRARLRRLPAPIGDVRRTWADLKRSRRQLGYRPATSLAEGLARFAEWLLRQRGVKRPEKTEVHGT